MVNLREGRQYDAVISGYAAGGEGVARLDGLAVFITGGIRGEHCRFTIDKVGKTAAWGHVTDVLTPSPHRIAPDCPHYGVCGGCQFRHMVYSEELSAKRQRVTDALQRIGGFDIPVSVIHGAEYTDRYRNKVQFPVAPPDKIGFFRRRSHAVIDVPDCRLQPETAGRVRAAVRAWMAACGVSAYDERTRSGLLRHLVLRTNAAGEALCCPVINGTTAPAEDRLVALLRAHAPELVGIVLNINTRDTNVVLGGEYRTLWGGDTLTDALCGLTFECALPSFYQVNRDQAERLYGIAARCAELRGDETLLDLYCGVGTIGLSMAHLCRAVIGVEVVPAAVENARKNAARNGITNARFLCADAAALVPTLAAEGIRPDVVLVDPPRKGLAPGVPASVAALNAAKIVYVSCDPATLARDVKDFAALGYRLVHAEAVDLFPRTAHVETICVLERDACRNTGRGAPSERLEEDNGSV